jgi:cytochrome bd-type quinol oxidase subunit 1
MEITALLLSRLQFAFTISFHIIFPSFTIGLAAWLTVVEVLHLATGRPTYRLVKAAAARMNDFRIIQFRGTSLGASTSTAV